MSDLPETLYKYRDWDDDNHKKILTQNEIYFASPKDFNDPFDSNIPVRFDLKDRETFINKGIEVFSRMHPDWDLSRIKEEAIKKYEEYEQNPSSFLTQAKEIQFSTFSSSIGIFSLSETRDNIIMWSHYSNSHKGFCIGFDKKKTNDFCLRIIKEKFYIKQLKEIIYEEKYPLFDRYELNVTEVVEKPLSVKSKDWSYEKEYRLIMIIKKNYINCLEEYRKVIYNNDMVNKIILGCKISKKNEEEIKETLRKKKTHIPLYKCKLKEVEYGLDLVPVNF